MIIKSMLPYSTFGPISLGFLDLQPWGIATAIGILLSAWFAAGFAKRKGLDEKKIYDIIFYAVLSGFIGARISYVFENWELYSENIMGAVKIWQGGLSFSAGLITAAIVSYLYIRKHHLNFAKYADVMAPTIVIAHIFGRIGCYLIGDHLGISSALPWAIMQQGALRHPIILYEIIYLCIILFILLKVSKLKVIDGTLFTLYLTLYSAARFANDFFRVDPTYYGLTTAQYAMIFLFFGAIFWYRFRK
jgi:phosphatidylglycerol:prolipoprotein diacylglycerol transferase